MVKRLNYKFVSPNQNEEKRIICKVISGTTKPIKSAKPNKTINSENWNDQQNEQLRIKQQFKELFEPQGKLNRHEVRIEFKQNAKTTQQKGRRVPIQIQDAVQAEIDRLLEEGHFEKVNEVTDKRFIQPVVITVKKDENVKVALDARALNNEIVKDKYHMPNLEHLVDLVAEQLDSKKQGKALYTSLDMRYAYGQVPLEEKTPKHCNFKIIGGNATGTIRFVTGFYGLTIMPTEFPKAMDQELGNLLNTYVFLDDTLIVTKGSMEKHFEVVKHILKSLDNANIRLKWEKCKFSAEETDWLGHKLSPTGIKPINSKVQAITEKLTSKSLKELGSYLGAVNQLNRFITNLAQLCHDLRPLYKKDQPWNWEEKHDKAIQTINEKVKQVAEVGHFKRSCPIRIICDASKSGLGAVLQQNDGNKWRPIHFASRFLTPLESKYSVNELELLAVVWAVEHFKNYLYGSKFQIASDHQALASVSKGNKSNKTLQAD